MHTFRTRFFALFVLTSGFLFTACGDVGDAPQAATGEAVAVAGAEGTVIPIDTARSQVQWRAAKVTRSHDGGFRQFDGTVTVNGDQVTAVKLDIDTPSIWSDTEKLTQHLESPDFFDVQQYPTATFVADQIVPTDTAGATHLVTGNLTMHGQTNSVTFPATINMVDGTVHATADFIIDRTRWGINYKGAADDLIENEVRLIMDITAGADAGAVAVGDTLASR